MPFTWKNKKDKFKGEGIYFFTFVVNNRVDLLGTLRKLERPDKDGHIAVVDATDLGNMVYREFNALQTRYQGFEVIAKQIMPNHFHAVAWCKEEFGGESVKMVARGFSQACSKWAREMRQARLDRPNMDGTGNASFNDTVPSVSAQSNCANSNVASVPSLQAQSHCATFSPYDCGNGANTLFATPYIRTLSHAGQLRHMIDYTHSNPDNAWIRHENPDLYVIRRDLVYAGLKFDLMGKERLLTYPDCNVVALSRSLSDEEIGAEVRKALYLAESGTVTYTAAINKGEASVAKAVRGAGWPLVVMMLDGFPPAGSEAEKYYHPKGVYHTACGEGRLLLMAPSSENYEDSRVIELTEQELIHKAAEKRIRYEALPHTSTRWRMIAGNVMLRMIAEVD